MIGVFKEHLNIHCNRWMSCIKKEGKARIDISIEFEKLFAHTINHICFGEDFNDDKFEFMYYNRATDNFTQKKVSMR